MIHKNGRTLFGFLPENPHGDYTDTIDDMIQWRNNVGMEKIINHIKSLKAWYMCGLAQSEDAFTGELYHAALYRDGVFTFPIDILRYLERGNIHGVPKEYEDYLINEVGL